MVFGDSMSIWLFRREAVLYLRHCSLLHFPTTEKAPFSWNPKSFRNGKRCRSFFLRSSAPSGRPDAGIPAYGASWTKTASRWTMSPSARRTDEKAAVRSAVGTSPEDRTLDRRPAKSGKRRKRSLLLASPSRSGFRRLCVRYRHPFPISGKMIKKYMLFFRKGIA